MKSKSKDTFTEGQELNYIGKGFLNYNKDITKCTFISYEGQHDAYISYNGIKVLVYTSELTSTK